MDLSTQYPQQQHEAYDPSQVQPYDQSTQTYYGYHQYNYQQQYPYYTQDYANAYQQQEPSSIHPPGVPIPPEQSHLQTPYYPQGVVGQHQPLNYSDSAVTEGMNPTAAAAVPALPQQQWQGNSGGYGPHQQIGPTPYAGGGPRGGAPFRGGRSGHFGSRPGSSGFRGKGRGRGRGGSLYTPVSKPAMVVQGESSQASAWPTPCMAWCELCRVDCNTPEILEQHKNGKKHKKNLKVYEELQNLNKLLVQGQNEQVPLPQVKQDVPTHPQKVAGPDDKQPLQENSSSQAVTNEHKVETEHQRVSEDVEPTEEPVRKPGMDHFAGRGRGVKRKMRGGRAGKLVRTFEGSRRPTEPPEPKQVIPLVCELCNVKCESPVVFQSHLSGKKHLSNLKRFQGQQEILGQAALQALYPALQALYPALQALYPPNPNVTSTFAPQIHLGGHGSEGHFPQPVFSMFPSEQATTSASAPTSCGLELKEHQEPTEHAQFTSEAGTQDAATVEAKSEQQLVSVKPEAE